MEGVYQKVREIGRWPKYVCWVVSLEPSVNNFYFGWSIFLKPKKLRVNLLSVRPFSLLKRPKLCSFYGWIWLKPGTKQTSNNNNDCNWTDCVKRTVGCPIGEFFVRTKIHIYSIHMYPRVCTSIYAHKCVHIHHRYSCRVPLLGWLLRSKYPFSGRKTVICVPVPNPLTHFSILHSVKYCLAYGVCPHFMVRFETPGPLRSHQSRTWYVTQPL